MYFFPDQIALVVQQLYRNSLLEIKRAFARTLPHKYKNSATIKIQAHIADFQNEKGWVGQKKRKFRRR